MSERLYANNAAAQGGEAGSADSASAGQEDVVDAEFEEMKDDKK